MDSPSSARDLSAPLGSSWADIPTEPVQRAGKELSDMRKPIRTLAIGPLACALALGAPGLAQARHHHAKQHQRAHKHARLVHVRPAAHPAGGTPTSSSGSSQQTPQAAATVVSFENGVLTLMLGDNSKLSGAVTQQTEIHCEAAPAMAHAADHGDGGGQAGNGDNR